MGNLAGKSQTNTSKISSGFLEEKIENELISAEVSFAEKAGPNFSPVEQTPLTKKIATHFAQSEFNHDATETPFHLMRKKILRDLVHADSIDPRSPSQRIPRTPLNIQKEDNESDEDTSHCAAFNKQLADIMIDDCNENVSNNADEDGDGLTDQLFQDNDISIEAETFIQPKNEFRAEIKHSDDSKIHHTSLNKRAVISSRIPLSVINQRGITQIKRKSPEFKNEI